MCAGLCGAIAASGCGANPVGGWTSPVEPEPDAGAVGAANLDAGIDAPITGVDASAVLQSISKGAYTRSVSFTQVSEQPYPSLGEPGALVSEWVSTSSLDAYLAISPEVVGSGATVPVGTTIVREVLSMDGGVEALTLMHKGPPGYNPALSDWWFALTDPDGVPIEADGGAEEGRLAQCFSCHVPRRDDGYLFGVPLGDRRATPDP